MAAKKSGGTASRTREKNQRVAQAMKKQGVTRTVMNCPLCHGKIAITGLIGHLGVCHGRR